ncbi:MAG: hydantoinase/oxoprolinase family protein [Candidatus Adiutrix sp.]|jgi:N-methylhydantoinase A/oxoprolinase/acetone carboxylase beta subunit|nr:hydantoinase/oxoprolinase family protein [Candidatus Adiutrix sp.]
MENNLILGIDTGGTHTDAVVFNPASRTVAASAKAETTHHDLALGIAEALRRLAEMEWAGGLGAISRIHLSTTLATNAIAENLGRRVGLILMGYDADQAEVRTLAAGLPQVSTVFIGGRHNFYGQEEEPLDEAALREAVSRLEGRVSGWAVSGFFSVKNPGHELAAANIIKSLSGKPVTLGRDLTGRLDAIRRAATAALNAGLVPIIARLLDAVKLATGQVGLTAQLMVVKGDGSLVSEDWARQKPIETVVSGPAAGLVGARALTRGFLSPGEKDLWVLDVGGTTSDLALVKGGLPAVNPNGARVGNWDTMTMAVETRTRGLGGDSFVEIDSRGNITLGPRRVLPLCRLAHKWPHTLETLRSQKQFGAPSSVAGLFLLPGLPPEPGLGADEAAVLEALQRETPFSVAKYSEEAFAGQHHFLGIKSLEHPSVMISAFTPTDAMAILGMYNHGCREAAELGAALLGRAPRWSAEELARRVLDEFGRAMTQEIVSYGFERDGVEFRPADFSENGVFGAALGRRPQGHIEMNFQARETVVLLGAPAGVLAPFLGQNLKARVLVPPVYDVASAVGAAASPVHLTRQVEIHTLPYFTGYRLFLPDRVRDGETVEELAAEAETYMGEHMRALAELAGAGRSAISVARTDRRVTMNDGSKLDLGATLTFTAGSAEAAPERTNGH